MSVASDWGETYKKWPMPFYCEGIEVASISADGRLILSSKFLKEADVIKLIAWLKDNFI